MSKLRTIGCYIFYIIQTNFLFGQTDSKPESIKNYIKKESGKYGIQSEIDKSWAINPEYDKITAISFSEKEHEIVNKLYFKLWKGDKFDLIGRFNNKKNYFTHDFIIITRGASNIHIPNKIKESSFSLNDIASGLQAFISFQVDGKWGWYSEIDNKNYTQKPTFDSIPQLFVDDNYFSNAIIDKSNLLVKIGETQGLYSFSGKPIIKPGNYKSFKYSHNLLYDFEIIGKNNLLGFANNNSPKLMSDLQFYTIDPNYVSFDKTELYDDRIRSQRYFIQCKLPNGNYEFYEKGKNATNDYIKLKEFIKTEGEKKLLEEKGFVTLKSNAYSIIVYKNWKDYCNVYENSITIDASLSNSPIIFSNSPNSWLSIFGKKAMSGSMRIDISISNKNLDSIQKSLSAHYMKLGAVQGAKNIYRKNITLNDGRTAQLMMFYTNELKGIGFVFKYYLLIHDGLNKILLELHMSGESDTSLESKNYEEWSNYFSQVLGSIKMTTK